ncbi:hypothetical protein A3A63_00740 [Candidatus Gottesmanbacteria bacterium RIFCSPLOWO2_01_FULL_46_9]|uniref:Uncharacterized protein n=1 Tax=Candidatus Gottesmanbacteria bacterium RIFCSPLOWO2_01_FULL_46_9 TaxID=1798394 RepID=A0A1F6B3L0_9BACT|nr:MAG: hypothetical protein A3A63_00740 [Candidatus Gottesmanbacteria bacterium RIFCSPLOWO2_01_FULL_46_9]
MGPETLNLEARLRSREVQLGGQIYGLKPIAATGLPKGTGQLNWRGNLVLVVAGDRKIVVLGAGKLGNDLDRLIKNIIAKR